MRVLKEGEWKMLAAERWRWEKDVKFGASTGVKGNNHATKAGNAYHRKVFRTLAAEVALNHPARRLLVEPWLRSAPSQRLCSPDTVLLDEEAGLGIVIEVKKNWRDGKDQKLLDLYLPACRSAFGLEVVKPLVIVGNARGLAYEAWTSLQRLEDVLSWRPGDLTPVLLLP